MPVESERRNRKPIRPADLPIHTNPTNMDFEKRRLVVSSSIPKHSTNHEDGGSDEINLDELEGESYEMRILKEALALDTLRNEYASLIANEMYASDRRGFEIR